MKNPSGLRGLRRVWKTSEIKCFPIYICLIYYVLKLIWEREEQKKNKTTLIHWFAPSNAPKSQGQNQDTESMHPKYQQETEVGSCSQEWGPGTLMRDAGVLTTRPNTCSLPCFKSYSPVGARVLAPPALIYTISIFGSKRCQTWAQASSCCL